MPAKPLLNIVIRSDLKRILRITDTLSLPSKKIKQVERVQDVIDAQLYEELSAHENLSSSDSESAASSKTNCHPSRSKTPQLIVPSQPQRYCICQQCGHDKGSRHFQDKHVERSRKCIVDESQRQAKCTCLEYT